MGIKKGSPLKGAGLESIMKWWYRNALGIYESSTPKLQIKSQSLKLLRLNIVLRRCQTVIDILNALIAFAVYLWKLMLPIRHIDVNDPSCLHGHMHINMEPSPSSSGTSSMKYTFACVSCSERKVKCNRQSPCSACIRHKVPCTFRAPKPPRRRRKLNRAELKDERLKRYEVLLQEKGIDPNQSTDNSQAQSRLESSRSRVPQYVWQLPTTSTDSTPQETVFEPFLLQGERGAKLVDK